MNHLTEPLQATLAALIAVAGVLGIARASTDRDVRAIPASATPAAALPTVSPSPLPPSPQLARYIYKAEGWGAVAYSGERKFGPEMTIDVHRRRDRQNPSLGADEVIQDMQLGADSRYVERNITAYRDEQILQITQGGTADVPFAFRSTNLRFDPPPVLVPAERKVGQTHTSLTRANDESPSDPAHPEFRDVDWSVKVLGRESLRALGRDLDTWVVRVEQSPRNGDYGSDDFIKRVRTYWYAPAIRMWAKIKEDLEWWEFGGGNAYQAKWTASLVRIEDLPKVLPCDPTPGGCGDPP